MGDNKVLNERRLTGSFIHHTAVVHPDCIIEPGAYIGPYCIIGEPAEISTDWTRRKGGAVIIQRGAVLTGHVTVDSGSSGVTVIGADSFLMKQSLVGHDAVLGIWTTLSPGAKFGGGCTIGNYANIGMNAVVHQQTAVPAKCMVGMGAVITKKAAKEMNYCETWAGNPARKLGKNKKWQK